MSSPSGSGSGGPSLPFSSGGAGGGPPIQPAGVFSQQNQPARQAAPQQQQQQQPMLPKSAVLLLFKGTPPFVLFCDNPEQMYQDISAIIKTANPKSPRFIEKQGIGPIKKVCFMDTEILGVSLQSVQ